MKEKEITKEYTRFERARIIGARALQIARGAPIMIKTDLKDPIEIAKLEFEQGATQIDVKRDNKKENRAS
ncbi:DNA-directed RNA polymerase subunit K [Candidatus Micrarchaeota archaeon RBG_16_36_9]|nr:MAG: DNA-directed RNA polymerase subunit K [Candidatus Micrarchaeota archaeon RBG_16_36_9]